MRFEADEVSLVGGIRHGRTLGSPVAIEIANTEWPKWEEEMSPGPGPALQGPHPAPAGPRRPGRDAQVRPRRRPRRPGAGLGPGDGGPGGGRHRGQAAARPARRRRRQPHRPAGRRRGPTPSALPRPERPAGHRRLPGALLRPRGRERMVAAIKAAAKDGDSLGGVAEVVAYGVPVGLGQPRPLGPPARRPAGPGAHEHPGRQGGRDRRGLPRWPACAAPRPTTPSAWPTPTRTRPRAWPPPRAGATSVTPTGPAASRAA